jgi:hypothetical protein
MEGANAAGGYNTQFEPMSTGTAGKPWMKKRSSVLSVDAEKSTAILSISWESPNSF